MVFPTDKNKKHSSFSDNTVNFAFDDTSITYTVLGKVTHIFLLIDLLTQEKLFCFRDSGISYNNDIVQQVGEWNIFPALNV